MKAFLIALLTFGVLSVAPTASAKDRHKHHRHHSDRHHSERYCAAHGCHGHHHSYYRYRDRYYEPRRETVISVPGVGTAYIRR
jgi:hypothetical protein